MKSLFLVLALSVTVVLAACGQQAKGPSATSPTPSATTSASATASATAQPSAPPSPSPGPSLEPSPAWPPAGFTTAAISGGSSAAIVNAAAVRVGTHPGYDRFVIEFSGRVPSYSVTLQANSRFTVTPKGGTVTLQGTGGVLITLQHINWTVNAGPTAFRPEFTYLREARLVQNFEGIQQWGLGTAGTPAMRVFTLTSPDRLVIDITTR